ncbi:MAG: hypothetical protein ABI886_13900 [Betaproteobacteria bacterium]
MDKCLNCQYYDRKREKSVEGRSLQWGQCRRAAPMLNPTTAKSYMIEGVWPTVRDDDWCGEWKTMTRRLEPRLLESVAATAGSSPAAVPTPRMVPYSGGGAMAGLSAGSGGSVNGPMARTELGAD